jgi:hypothetical protein
MPRIIHNGTTYDFARYGHDQEGNWCRNNQIVHLALQQDLTKQAKSEGLTETHNFSRRPPVVVRIKEPRVKGPRKARSPNKGKFAIKLGHIRVGA